MWRYHQDVGKTVHTHPRTLAAHDLHALFVRISIFGSSIVQWHRGILIPHPPGPARYNITRDIPDQRRDVILRARQPHMSRVPVSSFPPVAYATYQVRGIGLVARIVLLDLDQRDHLLRYRHCSGLPDAVWRHPFEGGVCHGCLTRHRPRFSTEVSKQQHRLMVSRFGQIGARTHALCDSHCIPDPIETSNHGRVHGCAALLRRGIRAIDFTPPFFNDATHRRSSGK